VRYPAVGLFKHLSDPGGAAFDVRILRFSFVTTRGGRSDFCGVPPFSFSTRRSPRRDPSEKGLSDERIDQARFQIVQQSRLSQIPPTSPWNRAFDGLRGADGAGFVRSEHGVQIAVRGQHVFGDGE
jgi:hypothetical protein